MKSPLSRKEIVTALFLGAGGVAAGLLPWYRLTIFGGASSIQGIDLWQGKVVVALLVALAALTLLARSLFSAAPWRPCVMIAVGVAITVIAAQYIGQVVFPAPTTIEVREGGETARALANEMVKGMDGHLSVGAPMALALGLSLVVVGASDLRSNRRGNS
jgi:hypothetical protein